MFAGKLGKDMEPKKDSFLKRNHFIILLFLLGIVFLTLTKRWDLYVEPIQKAGRSLEEFLGMELFPKGSREGTADERQPEDDGNPPGQEDEGPLATDEAEEAERENGESQAEEEPGAPTWQTVEDSYFDDALFIGDSRIVGLRDYGKLEGSVTFYAYEGMNIFKMLSAKIVEVPGQRKKISVEDALAERQFGKIYLMVGINELDIGTVERYENKYRETIERIRELQPDAIIYVQSIMLVTQKRAAKGDFVTNEGIVARNEAISGIADNKTIFYLDVNEAIVDESGGMNPSYTTDGIHLKAKYVPLYADYLRTHAILPATDN